MVFAQLYKWYQIAQCTTFVAYKIENACNPVDNFLVVTFLFFVMHSIFDFEYWETSLLLLTHATYSLKAWCALVVSSV